MTRLSFIKRKRVHLKSKCLHLKERQRRAPWPPNTNLPSTMNITATNSPHPSFVLLYNSIPTPKPSTRRYLYSLCIPRTLETHLLQFTFNSCWQLFQRYTETRHLVDKDVLFTTNIKQVTMNCEKWTHFTSYILQEVLHIVQHFSVSNRKIRFQFFIVMDKLNLFCSIWYWFESNMATSAGQSSTQHLHATKGRHEALKHCYVLNIHGSKAMCILTFFY